MLPCPSALNTPVRASGVALMAPTEKASCLVTKTYWPFKLAVLYFPTGGGGLTKPLPPPQAAVQRAVPAVKIRKRRFIAHLAGLPFVLASSQRQERGRSLLCCERQRLGRPSLQRRPRRKCYHRESITRRRCAPYPQVSILNYQHG